MKKALAIILLSILVFGSCKKEAGPAPVAIKKSESVQAKALLQGIWLDSETDMVAFKVDGDTIFYPDAASQPAYFRIIGDSLELGINRYLIIKQSQNVFWFQNQVGDVMKLVRGTDPDLRYAFQNETPEILTVTEVMKIDSVVFFNGERYHWYIAINPTRYRVVKTIYNSEGVGVENVYYDNIIHISLFKGAQQLFSRDFKKNIYGSDVPETFLEQSILNNMRFDRIDSQGFHFVATICIPDGASCYLVETLISFDGELSMKLLEY